MKLYQTPIKDTSAAYGILERTSVESDLDRAAEEIVRVGYSIIPSGLGQVEIDAFSKEFDLVHRKYIDEFGLNYLTERDENNTVRLPLAYSSAFLALAKNPNVLALVDRLIHGRFMLNQQNAIVNPPGARYNQGAWHRDLPYQHFVSSRPLAVNALYCVDDFTSDNGATLVLPASHKDEPFPSEQYVASHAIAVTAPAGSFIVLDCMCFHRGGYNGSTQPRRAVNHVYSIPLIKQQIAIGRAVDTKGLDEDSKMLLGTAWEVPISIGEMLKNRPLRKT
jgi:ectoine hydroxylase-related dioxygenase (phytanoyl-CoA dioxygenase family)